MFTNEQARNEFSLLAPQEKQLTVKILVDLRNKYGIMGMSVDIPYFFYSLHRPLFARMDSKFTEDFLAITQVEPFTNNAIYLISHHIIKGRK